MQGFSHNNRRRMVTSSPLTSHNRPPDGDRSNTHPHPFRGGYRGGRGGARSGGDLEALVQTSEATDDIRSILEKKQDEDGGCYTDVSPEEEDVMTAKQKETQRQAKDENGEKENCHDELSNKENSGAGLKRKQKADPVFKSDSSSMRADPWMTKVKPDLPAIRLSAVSAAHSIYRFVSAGGLYRSGTRPIWLIFYALPDGTIFAAPTDLPPRVSFSRVSPTYVPVDTSLSTASFGATGCRPSSKPVTTTPNPSVLTKTTVCTKTSVVAPSKIYRFVSSGGLYRSGTGAIWLIFYALPDGTIFAAPTDLTPRVSFTRVSPTCVRVDTSLSTASFGPTGCRPSSKHATTSPDPSVLTEPTVGTKTSVVAPSKATVNFADDVIAPPMKKDTPQPGYFHLGTPGADGHPSSCSAPLDATPFPASRPPSISQIRCPGSQGFDKSQGTPSFVTGASIQKPVVPPSVVATNAEESSSGVSTNNSNASSSGRQMFKRGGFDAPGCFVMFSVFNHVQMRFNPTGNFTFGTPGGYGYHTSYSVLLDTSRRPAYRPPSIDQSISTGPSGVSASSRPVPPLSSPVMSAVMTASVVKPAVELHSKASNASSARQVFQTGGFDSTGSQIRCPGPQGFDSAHGTPSVVAGSSIQKPVTHSCFVATTANKSSARVFTNSNASSGRVLKSGGFDYSSYQSAYTKPPRVSSSSRSVPPLPSPVLPATTTASSDVKPVGVHSKASITALPPSVPPKTGKSATIRPFVFTKATIRYARDMDYRNKSGSTFGSHRREEFHAPRRHPYTPGSQTATSTSVQGQSSQSITSAPATSIGPPGVISSSKLVPPLPNTVTPAVTTASVVKSAISVPSKTGFGFGSRGKSSEFACLHSAHPLKPSPIASNASVASVSSTTVSGSSTTLPPPIFEPPAVNQSAFANLNVNGAICDLMKNERMRSVFRHRDPALFDQMMEYATNAVMKNSNI